MRCLEGGEDAAHQEKKIRPQKKNPGEKGNGPTTEGALEVFGELWRPKGRREGPSRREAVEGERGKPKRTEKKTGNVLWERVSASA